MNLITVKHNFETAHRLPFLSGKCENLHGHSWWVEFTIGGFASGEGVLAEYGRVKSVLRGWIDEKLDHGTMLGYDDLLARDQRIRYIMGKAYVFDVDTYTDHLPWPTVENVAEMLFRMAEDTLKEHIGDAEVQYVTVHETHVNSATYRP